jgi:hypothetical protein
MRISELLPLMASQGDKFSILRGYSSLHSNHGTGTYIAQTGTPESSKKLAYPSTGAVVALKIRIRGRLPRCLPTLHHSHRYRRPADVRGRIPGRDVQVLYFR